MQTFLPYPDFEESAACLDNKRLGKQRVEVLQILKALTGESKGWMNHPATKMWRGSELHLIDYGMYICREWRKRGFKDTCLDKIQGFEPKFNTEGHMNLPCFLLDTKFFEAHRSNLMRKDPAYYGKFFGEDCPQDLPYVWPTSSLES